MMMSVVYSWSVLMSTHPPDKYMDNFTHSTDDFLPVTLTYHLPSFKQNVLFLQIILNKIYLILYVQISINWPYSYKTIKINKQFSINLRNLIFVLSASSNVKTCSFRSHRLLQFLNTTLELLLIMISTQITSVRAYMCGPSRSCVCVRSFVRGKVE